MPLMLESSRRVVAIALLVMTADGCGERSTGSGGTQDQTPPEKPMHTESGGSDETRKFEPGDVAVYAGQGLVHIEGQREIDGKVYLVSKTEHGATIAVPVAKAPELLRSPVSPDEAKRLLAILRGRDGEPPDDRQQLYRTRDAKRTMVNGSLEEQVRALNRMYRSPYKPSLDDGRWIVIYEGIVLAELAHVAQTTMDDLVAELHRIHPAFSAENPRPPEFPVAQPSPKPPVELANHDYLGIFTVADGRLFIGENIQSRPSIDAPSAPRVLESPAAPGTWHAFLFRGKGPGALIAIHSDRAADFKKVQRSAKPLGDVDVNGGQISVIDAAVRSDPAALDEVMFPLFPTGLVLDRGCQSSTLGDGTHQVRGVLEDGRLVFVAVDF
jgi:RNA polymerase-interacting CarD/CdnL/TRCF family regulator